MKIAGIILIIFGLVDLVGNYADFDLWTTIGIQLPEIIWKFSAYIEIAAGFFLFNMGSGDSEAVEEA
ncbi:MAG: hypothetical protein OEY19_10520 [Gammaproteobacteria bacterium]|nr:hypothetical protein [Gammaproteobacteria bacterium]